MNSDSANKILVSFGIDERSYKDVTKQIKEDFTQIKHLANRSSDSFGKGDNALRTMQLDLGNIGLATSELILSFTSLKAILDTFSEYTQVFSEWYDDIFGLAAATKAAGGDIASSLAAVQDVAKRGFLSEQEASAIIKRFISYGYSAEQAAQMTNALTNTAIVLRKENFSLEQAVERASYGITAQQSVMAKSAGMTQTLSDLHQRYAESIGMTKDEYNSLSSQLQHQINLEAEYQAYVEQGSQYQEAAAYYAETAVGANMRLSNAVENVKAALGSVLEIFAPLINSLANFVSQNKAVVAGMVAFVGALIGGVGLVVALSTAVKALKIFSSVVAGVSTISKAAAGGVAGLAIAVASIAAALVAAKAVSSSVANTFDGLDIAANDLSEGMDDLDTSASNAGGSIGGIGQSARNTAKELEKLRRDFLDDLKQIENRHKDTIANLTKQIKDANIDYRRAIDERNAAFEVSQAKEEKEHQEKVDELMTQIAFLQRYNNDYNKQKLANLQFALAEENAAYKKQTEAAKAELDLQNENDRKAYEEKQAQLQAELDDELAFMEKHREDLKEVQNWILEDEIDALKRRYEEQQASYAEQAGLAGTEGLNIGNKFTSSLDKALQDYTPTLSLAGAELGSVFGDSFVGKAWKVVDDFFSGMLEVVQWVISKITDAFKGFSKGVSSIYQDLKDAIEYGTSSNRGSSTGLGWATGGYTGRGAVDEIAGVVHKGEYVLPQEMVDQNTGTPKSMGNTYVINVNGTFATSAAERRKVADQIVAAINQNNKSRLEASWQ